MITKSEMLEKISQKVDNQTICQQIEKQIDEQIKKYNGVCRLRIPIDGNLINPKVIDVIKQKYTEGGWKIGTIDMLIGGKFEIDLM